MQIHNGVGDERPQFFSGSEVTFVHVAKTDRPRAKRLEDSVVLEHLGLEFFREHHWLHQIGHAEAGTRRLVRVSRADAAFGCSDLAPTQLALFIEQTVVTKCAQSLRSKFLSIVIPNSRRRSISATSVTGSITTPLPITQIFPRRRIPDGIRCRMYLTPRWMTVCPALLPPWLRTTMSALAVSTSMILPLPSSPHCAPIKIVLAIGNQKWAKNFPDASGKTRSGLADESYVGEKRLQGISVQRCNAATT